jgi:hypothetical protein
MQLKKLVDSRESPQGSKILVGRLCRFSKRYSRSAAPTVMGERCSAKRFLVCGTNGHGEPLLRLTVSRLRPEGP